MCFKNIDQEKIKNIFKVVVMVFALAVSVTCLVGLIVCIWSFVTNQRLFNEAHTNAAAAIITSNNKEFIETSIAYLERLQQIQKDAASNDVMSFLYSTLSSILVALCAGFVVKSYNNVEKAKESVDKAESKAAASDSSSKKAQENAIASNQYADTAKQCAQNAKSSANELKEMLENATQLYTDAFLKIRKQNDNIQVMGIHIEIVQARAALISYDKINANQRIFNILRMVKEIDSNANKDIIIQLQQELLGLETTVEVFKEYIDTIEDPLEKTSMLTAANRYTESLNNAVNFCENIMNEK